MSGSVDAILMASGFSRRFGEANKLLCPFLGKPLVAHALALIAGMPEIRRALVVAADEAVLAIARTYPVEVIKNRRAERGMCESIRLGVEKSDAGHYLFVPSDQPLLDAESVRRLIDVRDGYHIWTLGGDGRIGLPSLFPADLRSELLALKDGESGRAVIARHPGRVRAVQVDNPAILRDIDTPEDLERLSQTVKGWTVQ